MGVDTKIQWCHHTFNGWRGCEHDSPGCDNCYAEILSLRNPKVLGEWGPDGRRAIAAGPYWDLPRKWDRAAKQAGERRRVFCLSLGDLFEDRPELAEPRKRIFATIERTPNLDWLLLTKRPQNLERLIDPIESAHYPDVALRTTWPLPNLWLGVSCENREHGLPRVECLREIPAYLRFLSVEPLLEDLGQFDLTGIDWVIVGGESGTNARPCHIEWIASVVTQCRRKGVKVFVKQFGANPWRSTMRLFSAMNLKDKKGGDPSEWPEPLRVRELPR